MVGAEGRWGDGEMRGEGMLVSWWGMLVGRVGYVASGAAACGVRQGLGADMVEGIAGRVRV